MSDIPVLIARKYGKGLFEKHLQNYTPADPLYEEYTDHKGRVKRRQRELPPGLSKRDTKILKSVKRRAHYLDKGFHVCGVRFGWTFIIGLVPVVGDASDAALSYMLVIKKARKADLPDWLVRRMLVNNAISASLGFVPLVGDVMLASYKTNSRNAALLEEFLRIRGAEALKAASNAPVAEDPAVIKPGAGMRPGEITGESSSAIAISAQGTTGNVSNSRKTRSGSWFSSFNRKSTGNSDRAHMKHKAATDAPLREEREEVAGSTTHEAKKID